MNAIRFLRAELDYGCHHGVYELPDDAAPLLVVGRNGSGKSTLIESLLRAVFGFNRRNPTEQHACTSRAPWRGDRFRAVVRMRDARGETFDLHRDFANARVELIPLGSTEPEWRGDGNPASVSAGARRFRELLRERLGLAELSAYRRTAWIDQGALLDTTLDETLLHVAAGSEVDVDRALQGIETGLRDWTRDSIRGDRRPAQKERERERLADRLGEIEAALGHARAAHRERTPLVERLLRLDREREEAEREIETLEELREALARATALRAEAGRVEERVRRVEHALTDLEGAEHAVAGARLAADPGWDDPADLPERLATLEQLDERIAAGGTKGAGPALPLALALAVAAVTLAALTREPIGTAAGIAAGAALVWWGWRTRVERRRSIERERADTRRRRDALVASIPRGAELDSAGGREARRRRFEEGRRAFEALARAEREADAARSRAGRALGREVPGDVLAVLQTEVTEERNRLAELRYAAARASPDDAADAADEAAVRERLAAERRRRTRTDTEARALHERIARLRPARSPDALAAERTRIVERLAEIDETVDAFREAYDLLDRAREEFRRTDQDRLLAAVSRRMAELSGSRIGPISTPGDLADARLQFAGREVGLDYRPLSFGQLHLALLAVRLGAADFLSTRGVPLPLVLDEPFASLDDDHATLVWESLQRVAAERQVIVATQESGTLDRLGIRPQIRLQGEARRSM